MKYVFVKATRPIESSILFISGGPSSGTSIVYLGQPFNKIAARNPNWYTLFNNLDVSSMGLPFGATSGKYKTGTVGRDSYTAPSTPSVANPAAKSGAYLGQSSLLLSSRTQDTASLFNSMDVSVNGLPLTRSLGSFSTGNVTLDSYTPPEVAPFVNPTAVSGGYLGNSFYRVSSGGISANSFATLDYGLDGMPYVSGFGASTGSGDNGAPVTVYSGSSTARSLTLVGSVTNPTLGGVQGQWQRDFYEYYVSGGNMYLIYILQTGFSSAINTLGSGYYKIPLPSGWAINTGTTTTPSLLTIGGANIPLAQAGTQVGTGTWGNTSATAETGVTTIHTGSGGLMVRATSGANSGWFASNFVGVTGAGLVIKFTATIPVVAV